ncbi:unnamed protein product [Trichogramma brassicae]|uniref:Uncharacterized protein n=1 Tax=Trichogramma brassicae TaxID=86971 RepID=A0A6H5J885_9HYME|nr:unnamed protein product [Trichogramma brassicae]
MKSILNFFVKIFEARSSTYKKICALICAFWELTIWIIIVTSIVLLNHFLKNVESNDGSKKNANMKHTTKNKKPVTPEHDNGDSDATRKKNIDSVESEEETKKNTNLKRITKNKKPVTPKHDIETKEKTNMKRSTKNKKPVTPKHVVETKKKTNLKRSRKDKQDKEKKWVPKRSEHSGGFYNRNNRKIIKKKHKTQNLIKYDPDFPVHNYLRSFLNMSTTTFDDVCDFMCARTTNTAAAAATAAAAVRSNVARLELHCHLCELRLQRAASRAFGRPDGRAPSMFARISHRNYEKYTLDTTVFYVKRPQLSIETIKNNVSRKCLIASRRPWCTRSTNRTALGLKISPGSFFFLTDFNRIHHLQF